MGCCYIHEHAADADDASHNAGVYIARGAPAGMDHFLPTLGGADFAVSACFVRKKPLVVAEHSAGEKWSETQYEKSRECVLNLNNQLLCRPAEDDHWVDGSGAGVLEARALVAALPRRRPPGDK